LAVGRPAIDEPDAPARSAGVLGAGAAPLHAVDAIDTVSEKRHTTLSLDAFFMSRAYGVGSLFQAFLHEDFAD